MAEEKLKQLLGKRLNFTATIGRPTMTVRYRGGFFLSTDVCDKPFPLH